MEREGGELAVFEVGNHWKIQEEIGKYRFSQWEGDKCARLQQYVGWYRAWQRVREAELQSRAFFDAVLLHRSDAFFLRDMPPIHTFPRGAVSVKDCQSWGGVNDKACVVPRALAALWMEIVVFIYVDRGALPAWFNAEQMLAQFAAAKRIPLARRPPEDFPLLDLRHFQLAWSEVAGGMQQRGGCFASDYASEGCVPSSHTDFVLARLCN